MRASSYMRMRYRSKVKSRDSELLDLPPYTRTGQPIVNIPIQVLKGFPVLLPHLDHVLPPLQHLIVVKVPVGANL